MRALRLATSVLAIAAAASSVHAQESAVRPFDGHSLRGWSGDARYWSVEDGAIVGRTTEAVPAARNTYLIHEATFADFELRFSYRISGGNSGVQYRSRDLGDFAVAGYQADIEAGESYTGILYEERGRGILAWRGERVRFGSDGSRSVVGTFGDRAELQGAVRDGWNDYVVRAEGNRVVHEINGVRMVEVVDDAPGAPRAGRIALQLHAGPPMEVRFKDLVVRPIGAAVPGADRETAAAKPPEWIWTQGPVTDGQRVRLRRVFALPAAARAARVSATCDNRFTLFLDGREVLAGTDWQRLWSTRALGDLASGRHVLAAECENEGGAAGFVLRMEVDFEGGGSTTIVTDGRWRTTGDEADDAWRAREFDDAEWSPARSSGPTSAPDGPWGDPFAPRRATSAESLTVMDGYRVELVHSAQAGEGSWIALGFDERGRVLVSQERGPLTRILRSGDGGIVLEEIPEAPRGSMGFCAAHGGLYLQGRGEDGYGLYRLQDADGDGRYEDVAFLEALGGGGEHGAHAVVPGPDGRLYLMNGNMSPLPERFAATSPHASWAEDVLLPRIEDPRGHANGVRAPGGHVLRTDPDGESWEIFAAGFRNPYDIAFGPDGELFTFDADMEWDLGLPWYRPTRIVHVVSGGEYGWRTGAGKWPPAYPDSLPAVVDVGLSSPTGMLSGAALAFPARMRRALIVGDWAYGRILAVHLEPSGASFTGTFEHFVTGRPLNVTDLAAGPDGALWFTTGGRGTQSGLYRVTFTGEPRDEINPPVEDPGGLRALRRELEALHGRADRSAFPKVWESLGHADRFVRYAARIALEFVPVGLWVERALAEPAGLRAQEALLALARKGEDADRDEVLRRLGVFGWEGLGTEERVAWLRVHEVALTRRTAPVGDDLRLELILRLDPRYPSGDVGVDRELLHLLVFLGGDVAGRALTRLESLEIGQGIDVAYALRLVADGLGEEGRERLFRWLGSAKAGEGGASYRGYLDAIEKDALARAPEGERDALAELAAPPPREVPDLSALGEGVRAWTMAELEPLLPAVSTGRDFDRGKAAFTEAVCATCHRFDGQGGDVGPDLTSVASRFSRRDLLRTILEPSADVSDQYQNHIVTLRDGRVLLGRIVRDDARTLELIVDPFTGRRETVAASDVQRRDPSPISPMPPGLIGALTAEEVLDLLAYLESGGNRSHPAFAR